MDNEELIQDTNEPISFKAHQAMLARMDMMVKRLWISLILVIVLLVATNGAWIWYESQFEVTQTTVTQENTDGTNNYNYIGNDGDITNGEANGDDTKPNP